MNENVDLHGPLCSTVSLLQVRLSDHVGAIFWMPVENAGSQLRLPCRLPESEISGGRSQKYAFSTSSPWSAFKFGTTVSPY